MFTFEDVVFVQDEAFRKVLTEVDNGLIALALKTANEEIAKKFFSNMSKRVGDAVREEQELLGPRLLSEVEAAQQQIVEAIKRLEAKGESIIKKEGRKRERRKIRMKNKKVYATPDVKGIYVLQSLRYQSKSHRLDETTEWEAKEKSDEEERLSALEIAKDEAYEKGRLDAEQDFKLEIEKIKSEYASLMALLQNAVNQLIDKREKYGKKVNLRS